MFKQKTLQNLFFFNLGRYIYLIKYVPNPKKLCREIYVIFTQIRFFMLCTRDTDTKLSSLIPVYILKVFPWEICSYIIHSEWYKEISEISSVTMFGSNI